VGGLEVEGVSGNLVVQILIEMEQSHEMGVPQLRRRKTFISFINELEQSTTLEHDANIFSSFDYGDGARRRDSLEKWMSLSQSTCPYRLLSSIST
jgi:hypothetical protein